MAEMMLLYSCPFCGSRTAPKVMTLAECDKIDYPDEYEATHYIAVCAYTAEGCGASIGTNDCTSPEKAAAMWNNRVQDPPELWEAELAKAFATGRSRR